jgi:hypothetical protein
MVDPNVTGMPTISLTRTFKPDAQLRSIGPAARATRQVSMTPISNLSMSTPATST